MKFKTLAASAAVVVAGAVGGIALSTSAQATTPPTYEVVTASSNGTWLVVQGPLSKTQADAKLARLQLQKAAICRLGLAACGYTYTEYLLTPQS